MTPLLPSFFGSAVRKPTAARGGRPTFVVSVGDVGGDAARSVVLDIAPDTSEAREYVQELREAEVRVAVPPTAELSLLVGARDHSQQDGRILIYLQPMRRTAGTKAAKRFLDILGAMLCLIALAPLALLVALAIKLDTPGPVLFHQRRIGRDGRTFAMLKLRTMDQDAEARHAALIAQSQDPGWLHLKHDPRITRVGRLLRRWSLDEVPQLWNVVRGEMSLVGPRPLIEQEGSRLPAWARARAEIRPGMTGAWQVMGRTDIPFSQMLVLDWTYALTYSVSGDLRLLMRTVPALLGGKGAN